MAIGMHEKVSGVWKEITGAHENVSGTWKEITEGWEKVSGVWKQFYAAQNIVNMALFDGSDFLSRGADLTGNADGKTGIISVWVYPTETGITNDIYLTDHANFDVRINSANVVEILGANSSGTLILDIESSVSLSVNNLYHIVASWDLASTTAHLYINGVDRLVSTTLTNDTIDYTSANHYIGVLGNTRFKGEMGQLYGNWAEYIDLSVAGNLDKFYNGGPVDLGADGSTPTGTAPLTYLNNPYDTFEQNLGTGGNYSVSGTLAEGTNGPG